MGTGLTPSPGLQGSRWRLAVRREAAQWAWAEQPRPKLRPLHNPAHLAGVAWWAPLNGPQWRALLSLLPGPPAPDRMRSCHASSTAVTPAPVSSCRLPNTRAQKPLRFPVSTPPCPRASKSTSASDSTLNFQPEPPGRGPTASPAVLTPAAPGTPFSRLPIS